ncbi:bifunctional metallophosphatase/5'-nucleotidase [Agrilactobacillus yilanensis]|uniref:Bifunctional metallophosphatase/5'-nucleotidase n=1 Tax=Agrilactobacillus yilanensis TaxID=2485997 RepID=A0ABW4J5P3_9LACO|nr:bifunctional UDP-sugar hydrolase/5'-nucleotidase [Agrilactobacillus yilanensis]
MVFERIQILHTNDLHSHFENWPRIRRFIQQRQVQAETQGIEVFKFDIGDAEDRVHPLTEATMGQANIQLLNEIGYDGATIGNNEGIGNSHEQLCHLYDHANFDVLLANLKDETGQIPKFAKPYKIITTKKGTRLGVIGLTAPFLLTYQPNHWYPELVQDALPPLLAELKPQCDCLILLSHLGITMDRFIAQHFPEIQIVLGGHSHHLLPTGEPHGQTMLTAAGKWGEYIGQVDLDLNTQHQLTKVTATVQKTAELPEMTGDNAEIDGYAAKGHQLLQKIKVATLPETLKANYKKPTNMIRLALKALEDRGQTQAAVLNQGLFLKDLPAGLITMDDLHEQMPHPMHLLNVRLKGYDLWRLVMEMEKNRAFLQGFPIRGMSFRGRVFGELVYDGIKVVPGTRQVLFQDQEIDPEAMYTLTTLDHYMLIPFFPTIEIVGENQLLYPEFLRHVVAAYLKAHYPVTTTNQD